MSKSSSLPYLSKSYNFKTKRYEAYHHFGFICTDHSNNVFMRSLFDLNVPVELRQIVMQYFGEYGFAEHTISHMLLQQMQISEDYFRHIMYIDVHVSTSDGWRRISFCKSLIFDILEKSMKNLMDDLKQCRKIDRLIN